MRFKNRIHLAAALLAATVISLAPGAAAQLLHGHVPEAVAASRSLGPVARSTRMNLAIGLPLRNQGELATLVRQVADPASPNYRHYLTSEQFAERFGPTEADYQALASFMRANGLEVTGTHPNRMILDVGGPVDDVERTFHVNMVRWSHPTRGEFFAPDREPSIDAGVEILDISGLDNFYVPRPMDLHIVPLGKAQPLTTGSGPGGLFIGGDFRAAYAPSVTLNGAGQSVGLFELDGYYAADVTANFKQAGLPVAPISTVLLDGFSGSPGSGNDEVTLDIMMAAYMAPGASIIVYEGLSPNDVLNRMATDDKAAQLSSSWTFSPTNATTEQIFQQMIAQGQSLFQASGDDGAYHGYIMPPADDPNVTVVGGTSLTTSGAGGTWQSETAWADGGGGVSTVWPIPSYQKPVSMTAAGGSATMRNIPDVALIADIQTFLIADNGKQYSIGGTSEAAPLWAGFIALANQQAVSGGKAKVGFLNPTIYSIGLGSHYASDVHDITTGSNGFPAVTGYDLATGWGTPAGQSLINDLTGAPSVPSFSLSSSASTLSIAPGKSGTSTITVNAQNGFNGTVSLGVSGLPAGVTASFSPQNATTSSLLTVNVSASAVPTTATLTITGTSGTLTSTARLTLTITGSASFTLTANPSSVTLKPGGTGASTITLVPQNGFNGSVTASVSGVPSGVTATWGTSSGGGIPLNFSAASNASPGTFTVTVTGTAGSLSAKVTISLTITAVASDFTLTATPTTVSISPGSSGSSTITVNPQGGFSGTVGFSVSGLPSGVTASFSPASTTGHTTVTFTAAANAPASTTTVTITGTSGSLTAKTTVTLTVAPAPSFTLSASPSALTIARGSKGSTTITLTEQNGFNGTVTVSLSGFPGGTSYTWGPGPATYSLVLTILPSQSASPGQSTITVTGTSGNQKATTTITLTVK